MDAYELGVLIKDIDNFNMDNFDGRLRFQKTVHILQSFGVDLGYYYSWYLHGPYCPDLTKDGFELNGIIDKIPEINIEFANPEDQSRYNNFKMFMQGRKNDPKQLEIASSICFLQKAIHLDKDRVLKLTEGKRKEIKMEECEHMWKELASYGVVKA